MIEIKVNKGNTILFSFFSPCVPNEGEYIWIINTPWKITGRVWVVEDGKKTVQVTLMVE